MLSLLQVPTTVFLTAVRFKEPGLEQQSTTGTAEKHLCVGL